MNTLIFLMIIALTLRVIGAGVRVSSDFFPVRAVGWGLCLLAVWVATSAAGAWVSFIPALLLAVAGTLAGESRLERRLLWVIGDVATVLLSGLLALPLLALGPLVLALLLVPGIGFGIDWLLLRLPPRGRISATLLPVVGFLLLGLVQPAVIAKGTRVFEERLLGMAQVLPPGTTASREGKVPTALPNVPAPVTTDMVPPVTIPTVDPGASLDQTGTQWEPYLQWNLANPTYAGNPYDLVASVTFWHAESGETRTTEMFYAGGAIWSFRFTGTRTGAWTFTTQSADPELSGLAGTVTITPNANPNLPGFVTTAGDKWMQSGTGKVFIPQFVMYGDPVNFAGNPGKIDADIQTFLVEHGFSGFHVQVYCRWFDLNEKGCGSIASADPNPDPRTFEALELVITRTHAAGGVVHLWAWGDDDRGWNPKRWGVNGPQDRRLQRYIAARLGPLPGWTMGYGFDLWEWASEEQITAWHNFLQAHMGWSHPLGARASKNELDQLSEALDYAAYEQVRPDYAQYVAAISARPHKPTFSEDRFRIFQDTSLERNFAPEQLHRLMWQSAMAGGVANIWGNLGDGRESGDGSAPFPNAIPIKTYATFFANRFTADVVRCNALTDGMCLQRPTNAHFIFYKEATATLQMNLAGMAGPQRAVAVDTQKPYAELDLGRLNPTSQTWTAPYVSDWAIAVGGF